MTPEEIFNKLKDKFNDAVVELISDQPVVPGSQTGKPVDPFIVIMPEKVAEISLFLRDYEDFLFDELCCLSGIDYGDGKLGTVYHLFSFIKRHKIALKAIVPKDNPVTQSVSQIWLTADWHERESFDLIGINYLGHPDLRRILLPEDWEGHPLQKDYKVPEFYNGMKVPY